MTIDDIKALIAADESRTLELKKTTGELKDGMHSACALLNSSGGWLIIGITPKSLKIIGQEVTDSTKREIAQALSGIEPAVDVAVEYVDVPEHPGNKVIAMHFDGWVWGDKPYTYHGRPYYKVESTTMVMPRELYDERVREHRPQNYSWERIMADDVTLADLDDDLILGCVRRGVERGRLPETTMREPIRDILNKWKLLSNGRPTNGAALLFSRKIDEYPQFALRMARFAGTDKNEFIDNQRVEGNFFELLSAGMAFMFKHLNLSGKITNRSLMREEKLEVPYVALREALINSLSHRQWEKFKLTGSLAIYDDRIEISNPGVLPRQLTSDTMKDVHESYPYNELVAKALYHSTYLESWGTGVQRIVDACTEQGLPEPTWSINGAFITIAFKRPKHDPSTTQVSDQVALNHRPTTDQVPTNYHTSSTPVPYQFHTSSIPVQTLIEKGTDEFKTALELADLCGLKNIRNFRKYYLNPALADGAIERLYPDTPNHPQQKYRLTEAAKEWKNKKIPNTPKKGI